MSVDINNYNPVEAAKEVCLSRHGVKEEVAEEAKKETAEVN